MENKPELNTTYIPSKIAQRCPVCNGFGTLKYGEIQCHACDSKGYVLVPAKKAKSLKGEHYGQ